MWSKVLKVNVSGELNLSGNDTAPAVQMLLAGGRLTMMIPLDVFLSFVVIHLFIYWRLIAPSTVQDHLRAFHKFKSYSCHIKKKASNIQKTIHKNKQNLFFKSKNSTFGIALVYNSNKAGTCWYRWPFSLIYQYQFTKQNKKFTNKHHQEIKKDVCLNA